MPVVPCPHCSNPVTLPPTWAGSAYTCPHCRRVAGGGAPPPRPSPPPVPVPPPPSLSFDDDHTPAPRRRQPTGNPIWDFLTFRLMITPILIQIVFWLGTVACVVRGSQMLAESSDDASDRTRVTSDRSFERGATDAEKKEKATTSAINSWKFLQGIILILFGPLLIRVLCELDIILFKIHDELKVANDRRGRA